MSSSIENLQIQQIQRQKANCNFQWLGEVIGMEMGGER